VCLAEYDSKKAASTLRAVGAIPKVEIGVTGAAGMRSIETV
jgi:hypothetical protein